VPLLQAISKAAMPRMLLFEPLGLSITAWAESVCNSVDMPLMAAISAASIRIISSSARAFEGPHLANMAWSFSSLVVAVEPLLHAIASSALPPLHVARLSTGVICNQDFSNTAWALSVQPVAHPPCSTAIAAAAIRKITQCSPENLSKLAWANELLGSTSNVLSIAWALDFSDGRRMLQSLGVSQAVVSHVGRGRGVSMFD